MFRYWDSPRPATNGLPNELFFLGRFALLRLREAFFRCCVGRRFLRLALLLPVCFSRDVIRQLVARRPTR